MRLGWGFLVVGLFGSLRVDLSGLGVVMVGSLEGVLGVVLVGL